MRTFDMHTPITYYGGKQQLADTIIGMMPSHKIYCEPFFGGGAVFFAKGKSYLEVINDVDDRLITFYEVCQDENTFSNLITRIHQTLHSERYHKKAYQIWRNPSLCNGNKEELAWAVWLVTNMSFSGSPSGGWKWDNGTAGSHSGVVMDNYRQSFVPALHERLKNVQISCRDALLVIQQRDRAETFFFLDPPYPGCEQKHYKGYTFEHFEELLEKLTYIQGKFLLCNFDSDMLRKYVTQNNWNMTIKDMHMNVSNFKGVSRRKQEVMVYNYDIEPKLF